MKSILSLAAAVSLLGGYVVARIEVPTFGPELRQILSSQLHAKDNANIQFFSEASVADPAKIALDFFHENFPLRSGFSLVITNQYKSDHNDVSSMSVRIRWFYSWFLVFSRGFLRSLWISPWISSSLDFCTVSHLAPSRCIPTYTYTYAFARLRTQTTHVCTHNTQTHPPRP